MNKLLATLALLALVGCPGEEKKHDRTPDGWRIEWKDSGTVSSGLHTKGELYALFDAAFVRSACEVETKLGLPAGTVRSKLRKCDPVFEIRDHFYFPVEGVPIDAPTAQFASGETMNRFWIILAFWSRATADSPDPASVPATAPPWTVVIGPQTGNYYWGEEPEGLQYPALSYELHWFFSQDRNF